MSGAGTRRPVYNKELFRVPVQELPPDASQYRIVMLFRHIEVSTSSQVTAQVDLANDLCTCLPACL